MGRMQHSGRPNLAREPKFANSCATSTFVTLWWGPIPTTHIMNVHIQLLHPYIRGCYNQGATQTCTTLWWGTMPTTHIQLLACDYSKVLHQPAYHYDEVPCPLHTYSCQCTHTVFSFWLHKGAARTCTTLWWGTMPTTHIQLLVCDCTTVLHQPARHYAEVPCPLHTYSC